MNELLPIIRRQRRPLVIETVPTVPAPVKPQAEKPEPVPAEIPVPEPSEDTANN